MEQDGGLSFAEYTRLYYQDLSLATSIRHSTTNLEARIAGIHQAQHAIADLEKDREQLLKVTCQIEDGKLDAKSSAVTFVHHLHHGLDHFELKWEAAMQQSQIANANKSATSMQWVNCLRQKKQVLEVLQESLEDHQMLAKKVFDHPELLALVLALVHASQGAESVLALSEEIAVLAVEKSETLLLSLMDTLQAHGSYITESGSGDINTFDPLSPTSMMELELLEYLESCPSILPSHLDKRWKNILDRNVPSPIDQSRKVSSPSTSFSSTLYSMSSNAAQLWNSAATLVSGETPYSANTTPLHADSLSSANLSTDTLATASFTHESRHAKDVLGSIAAHSPGKRTVSMGAAKSEIRVVTPTKKATLSSGEVIHKNNIVNGTAFRIVKLLMNQKKDCKEFCRFPVAIALCRRLLLHHYSFQNNPAEHRRLSILLVVRWFAFTRLSALLSRPNSFGRTLAGNEHSWAFGGLQFGIGSTFAKAKMDHDRSWRESQSGGIMQGVWRGGSEMKLGELHRQLYMLIIRAVEGVHFLQGISTNEATDLVSCFGVTRRSDPITYIKQSRQSLVSTFSMRYQDMKDLWTLLRKKDFEEELIVGDQPNGNNLSILFAGNEGKGEGSLRLFHSLESAEEHLLVQQKETTSTLSAVSFLSRSMTNSSIVWGSPPSSPFHQAMNGENHYFSNVGNSLQSTSPEGDELLRAGIEAMLAKGYSPSVVHPSETNLGEVLEDARTRAKECFAFDDALLFTTCLARLPREGLECRRMLRRISQSRLERVDGHKRKREHLYDCIDDVERYRIILIERARLVYERIQEMRVRVWYATEVRMSAVVVQSREAAQKRMKEHSSNGQDDCIEWMQNNGIYNFEAGERLINYLFALDPAFQKIASDAKSFFRSPIWKRENAVARPFLEGESSDDDSGPSSVAILTFGVCSLAMLRPEDHRSSVLPALEDFLQRVQLLCTSLFLSETLQGVDAGGVDDDDDGLANKYVETNKSHDSMILQGLKEEGAVELLRRFQLHPSPRAKMQSILTLERLIIARLERPETQREHQISQPSQVSIASQDDVRSVASYGRPRRALSMYEEETGGPLNLHEALYSQKKEIGSEASTSTIIAPSSRVKHPTTDDVVTVLEGLLRDSEVRPKKLFATLQIIAAFSPLQVLDLKDEGKAFWDLALASLSLRKEAMNDSPS